PSLLRTVTDWKGKPSLRSTEVAEESYLPHFRNHAPEPTR
ncbi:hypothetical protein Tco_1511992, partial [Tanacetum coccineum]